MAHLFQTTRLLDFNQKYKIFKPLVTLLYIGFQNGIKANYFIPILLTRFYITSISILVIRYGLILLLFCLVVGALLIIFRFLVLEKISDFVSNYEKLYSKKNCNFAFCNKRNQLIILDLILENHGVLLIRVSFQRPQNHNYLFNNLSNIILHCNSAYILPSMRWQIGKSYLSQKIYVT